MEVQRRRDSKGWRYAPAWAYRGSVGVDGGAGHGSARPGIPDVPSRSVLRSVHGMYRLWSEWNRATSERLVARLTSLMGPDGVGKRGAAAAMARFREISDAFRPENANYSATKVQKCVRRVFTSPDTGHRADRADREHTVSVPVPRALPELQDFDLDAAIRLQAGDQLGRPGGAGAVGHRLPLALAFGTHARGIDAVLHQQLPHGLRASQ